jgi:hypothetical protein
MWGAHEEEWKKGNGKRERGDSKSERVINSLSPRLNKQISKVLGQLEQTFLIESKQKGHKV